MDDTLLAFLLLLLKFTPAGIGLCIFAVLMHKRKQKRALIRTAIRIQMEQLQAQQHQPPVRVRYHAIRENQFVDDRDPSQTPYRPANRENEVPLLSILTPSDTNDASLERTNEDLKGIDPVTANRSPEN